MAKGAKKKGANKKYVSAAVQLKHEKLNCLIQLLAAVVIGVAWWAFVSFSGMNDHSPAMSVVIFGGTVIIVIGIGLVGNRFAKAGTELNKLKNEYGVTEEQMREYEGKR